MGTEEIIQFWNGVQEVLNHPLVIGGVGTFTIGGLALIIFKIIFAVKKGDLTTIKADIKAQKKQCENYITNKNYNELVAYNKKRDEFEEKLLETIKNETIREELKTEYKQIVAECPNEIVVESVEKQEQVF